MLCLWLCEGARQLDIPLEINLLGLHAGRHYPCEALWQVAGEVGNTAVLGCDAHEPAALHRPEAESAARDLARRCGLTVLETVPLRHPF